MKLVSVSALGEDPETYIDLARRESVVITEQGKPVARLIAVEDDKEIHPEK